MKTLTVTAIAATALLAAGPGAAEAGPPYPLLCVQGIAPPTPEVCTPDLVRFDRANCRTAEVAPLLMVRVCIGTPVATS